MNPSSNDDASKVPFSSSLASGEVPDRMKATVDTETNSKNIKPGGVSTTNEITSKDIPDSLKQIPTSSTDELKKLATAAAAAEGNNNVKNDDGVNEDKERDEKEIKTEKITDNSAQSTTTNVIADVFVAAAAVASSKTTNDDTAALDNNDKKTPEVPKKRSRKKWKKPADKPCRPLSAYNVYFRKERAVMLGDAADKNEHVAGKKRVHRKTHGKIGFAEMARIIGGRWKALGEEEKEEFVEVAAVEKERYAKELAAWREEQKKKTIISTMGPGGRKSKVGKGSSSSKASDDGDDDLVESIAEEREKLIRNHQVFRMQMMQEMQAGHLARLPLAGMGGEGRPMPTIDYLRTMQDERAAAFFGRNRMGASSNFFSHYPSAAESSARDLFHSMSSMGSTPGGFGSGMVPGQDGSGRDSDQLRQLQLARMQMMNGGGGGGGSFGGSSGPSNMPGSFGGSSGMSNATPFGMGFGNSGGMGGSVGPTGNAMGNTMGTDVGGGGGGMNFGSSSNAMMSPAGSRMFGGGSGSGGFGAPFGSQSESQQQSNRQHQQQQGMGGAMGGGSGGGFGMANMGGAIGNNTGAGNAMNNAMGGAMGGGGGASVGFGMGGTIGNNTGGGNNMNNAMGMTPMQQYEQNRFNPDNMEAAMRRFQQQNRYNGGSM